MDVSRTRALRGPNLWSRHMAIEAIVSCSEAERAVGQMAGFETRLRALFPGIGALHPESGGPDISLARQLLGWQPEVALEDGLQRTIHHFRELLGQRRVTVA